jgi:OPA family glycerol-3-phosphate transporter-like MFS transporter
MVWTVWMTYGAFYFCRTNLSVAVPGIKEEYGFTGTEIGLVLMGLKITYAVGQLINGQLAERYSPRIMLAIGMFVSAAVNVCFGFSHGLYLFLFIWMCNGYFQSLGWTPCVRVVGNWIEVERRGFVMGIVGTGYQLTAGLTFVVAGVAVNLFGWRGAMFVPPLILVAAAIGMLFFLREQPSESDGSHRQKEPATTDKTAKQESEMSVWKTLAATVFNPLLWPLGVALGMTNAVRYGYLDWGVIHLVEVSGGEEEINTKVLKSAVKFAVLPLGGILGSATSGWISDRYFGSRRAPVVCTLLVCLCGITLAYDQVARSSTVGTLLLLAAAGFCIFGAQVILVGTAPADLARRGTSAAAAGFVNFFGYIGAAVFGDFVTGYVFDHYDWNIVTRVWAGWALLAAIMMAVLWNHTGTAHKDSE